MQLLLFFNNYLLTLALIVYKIIIYFLCFFINIITLRDLRELLIERDVNYIVDKKNFSCILHVLEFKL